MTDLGARLRDLVEHADAADLPDVIGDLAGALARAQARLLMPTRAAEPAKQGDGYQKAEDIAAVINTPASFLYELARQGRIPCERFGRYVRFSLDAVKAALAEEANSKSARLGSAGKRRNGKGFSAPATALQP